MSFQDSYPGQPRKTVGHELVLMPGAMVALQQEDGRILLTERSDDGTWCLPAGAAEPGGSFAKTAMDELAEETGIKVSERDLVPFGCLSEAGRHTIHYPNGDVTHCFALLFLARVWKGDPRPDHAEATEARYFNLASLPKPLHLPTHHALGMLSLPISAPAGFRWADTRDRQPWTIGHCSLPAPPSECRMPSAEGVAIRPASLLDSNSISAIYNAAITERGSTFETELRSAADFQGRVGDTRFPLLVGEGSKDILGWAGLTSYSSRPCYAGIGEASVYVAPQARGRGVGTALIEALSSEAEHEGFHKLVGKLFTDNIASIRLVEKCGFSSVGTHRRHGQLDGEWRDVLVVEQGLGSTDSVPASSSASQG